MRNAMQITLSLVLLAAVAGAQSPEQSWDNLRTLRSGEKIQVVDQKLKSLQGTFVSLSEEAITFRVKQDEITTQRADVLRVTSLQRGRRGHPRIRNALIGLAIGAGLGAASGAREAGNPDWPGGAEGAAIGIGIMGPIGAGIGALIPTSHLTIYRAERRKN